MRIALLIFTLLLSVSAFGAGQERFALVIGANIGEPGEEPLRFAEADASKMAEILTRFGSVSEENLLLLKGRSAERVEAAFAALGERIGRAADSGRETLLFVFYSGHADASAMHLGETRLEFDRLTKLVDDAGATLKVLVVDACRSGELTRVKGARPIAPFKIVTAEKLKSEGNAVITSSAVGEDAQESDRLGGGVFSHHFMMGLRGAADKSADRQVSLTEAYRYAYDETLRTTSRAQFLQHPTYAFKMKGREDIVLTRLFEHAGLGRLLLQGSGTWLLLNRENPSTGVIEVSTTQNSEVVMVPGEYTLRLRTARAVFEGKTTVTPGKTQAVRNNELQVVPYGRTVRKGYHQDRQRTVGLVAGGIVTGALTDGVGPHYGGAVGVRADFRPLSLEFRFRSTAASSENLDLALKQSALGCDLTLLKLYDPGLLSLGFGLRTTVDWIEQTFTTPGQAPNRKSLIGRVSPILRLERSVGPQVSVTSSAFVDGAYLIDSQGRRMVALPGIEFGVSMVFQ